MFFKGKHEAARMELRFINKTGNRHFDKPSHAEDEMQQQGHVLASIAMHAPPMRLLRASCKSLFCVCMVLDSRQFATRIIRTPMPMPFLKSWSC